MPSDESIRRRVIALCGEPSTADEQMLADSTSPLNVLRNDLEQALSRHGRRRDKPTKAVAKTKRHKENRGVRGVVPLDEAHMKEIEAQFGKLSARDIAMFNDPKSLSMALRRELDRKRMRRSKKPTQIRATAGRVLRPNRAERIRAAIGLRVPNSGLPWLDKMIRTSLRNEWAGRVLAQLVVLEKATYSDADFVGLAERAFMYADCMLAESERCGGDG